MVRFSRFTLAAAAIAAAARWLAHTRRALQSRPAADIRRSVDQQLPTFLDPTTRSRIARRVVQAIEGLDPVPVESTDPAARAPASPPQPRAPVTREDH